MSDYSSGDSMESTPINQLLNLAGSTALVTGAGRNIGEGIAHRLAEAGAVVLVTDLYEERARSISRRIVSTGMKAHAFRLDVSQADEVNAFVQDVASRFADLRILVNNAGIFTSAPAVDLSLEEWDSVFNVNVRGTFVLTRLLIRFMPKGSSIINLASVDGLRPGRENVHYRSSKAALLMTTRCLALEFAPREVRVNSICPGLIDSERLRTSAPQMLQDFVARVPLHRVGQPIDIANMALFLASPISSWITGQNFVVDGGYMLT